MAGSRWVVPLLGMTMVGSMVTGCSRPGTSVQLSKPASIKWVAVQDGAGAWRALDGGSFTVSASGRYGVAWACTTPGLPQVHVIQATVADTTDLAIGCPIYAPTPIYTLSGNLTGIPTGYGSAIYTGYGSDGTLSGSSPSFTVQVRSPSDTVVAYDTDPGGAPGTMVVQRDVPVTADIPSYSVDLSSGAPFAIDTLDAHAVPSGASYVVSVDLELDGGGSIMLQGNADAAASFTVLPLSESLPGDRYLLQARANDASSTVAAVSVAQRPDAATVLTLPPELPAGAGLQAAGSSVTATWGGFSPAVGQTVYEADALTSSPAGPDWIALVTPAWLGTATSYALPDLSSVAGWDTSWAYVLNGSSHGALEVWNARLGMATLLSLATEAVAPEDLPDRSSFTSSQRFVSVTP